MVAWHLPGAARPQNPCVPCPPASCSCSSLISTRLCFTQHAHVCHPRRQVQDAVLGCKRASAPHVVATIKRPATNKLARQYLVGGMHCSTWQQTGNQIPVEPRAGEKGDGTGSLCVRTCLPLPPGVHAQPHQPMRPLSTPHAAPLARPLRLRQQRAPAASNRRVPPNTLPSSPSTSLRRCWGGSGAPRRPVKPMRRRLHGPSCSRQSS